MFHRLTSLGLGISFLFLIGCGSDEVNHYTTPRAGDQPPHTHHHGPAPQPTQPTFVWDTPEGWNTSEGSSMRIGSFSIPLGEKEGDCSLIMLSGSAGGLVANINRWRGQVGLAAASKEEITAELKKIPSQLGEFDLCTLVNPENKEDAIFGALYFSPQFALFAKLKAPPAQLESLREEFISFCSSIKMATPAPEASK